MLSGYFEHIIPHHFSLHLIFRQKRISPFPSGNIGSLIWGHFSAIMASLLIIPANNTGIISCGVRYSQCRSHPLVFHLGCYRTLRRSPRRSMSASCGLAPPSNQRLLPPEWRRMGKHSYSPTHQTMSPSPHGQHIPQHRCYS